ncbi:GNAT family acetyltransferase [Cognatishimia sp. F0-27]|uniref:GNAT family acetyltransferase n=1 Tax=Cognatishimia sp. F0-27 TaxID=2816855 RepID=UPI001D0CA790|nr:GNAT family acetyltransferase [Cognatishimia sp. F0-27]MCC1494190.1 GNAT family acetyltransferase [Cognatishimia sp. F0-27]
MPFVPLPDGAETALAALWAEVDLSRPWNPADQDIAAFRAHPAAEILVSMEGARVIASAAVGHDGHRGWVYYVAVAPDRQGTGLGRAAMDAAEDWLRAAGAVKLMLMVRDSNAPVIDFYDRLGFSDDGVRVMAKWLDPARARLLQEHGP